MALRELINNLHISILFLTAGLALLGYWLAKTSLGRHALLDSRPRRNSLPVFLPAMFLLLWLLAVVAGVTIVDSAAADWQEYQVTLAKTVTVALINVIFVVLGLFLAKLSFARGLKGFGLNFKKLPGDIFYGGAYLFAVWPVFIGVVLAIQLVGKLIYGGDYNIPRHDELVLIQDFPQFSVRLAILISGAVITPIFEEITFRGLIQSTVRSYIIKPLPAIFVSSLIFTLAHPQAHWPAIFVLGMLMGYAYEKSGSLFRPIFIHAIFNGVTILVVMSST